MISISETYVKGISEKFNISRAKSVAIGGGAAALISLIFATNGGINFLDAADYFINQFGVALIGLVEVVVVAWFLRKLPEFQEHANGVSDISVGLWWRVCLGIITPIILGYMMFSLFVQNCFASLTRKQETMKDTPIPLLYQRLVRALFALAAGIVLSF